jgi:hypothetical protein
MTTMLTANFVPAQQIAATGAESERFVVIHSKFRFFTVFCTEITIY